MPFALSPGSEEHENVRKLLEPGNSAGLVSSQSPRGIADTEDRSTCPAFGSFVTYKYDDL